MFAMLTWGTAVSTDIVSLPRCISLASPAHWKSSEMEEKETLIQGTQELNIASTMTHHSFV